MFKAGRLNGDARLFTATVPAIIREPELAFDAEKWRHPKGYGMTSHGRPHTCLIVGICLSGARLARADVVSDWNAIAAQTAIPVRPGPSAILDLAMVHAAMHDAIQAYQRRFESYSGPIPNAAGSPIAAAARAAHDVLVARFPSRSGTYELSPGDGLLYRLRSSSMTQWPMLPLINRALS